MSLLIKTRHLTVTIACKQRQEGNNVTPHAPIFCKSSSVKVRSENAFYKTTPYLCCLFRLLEGHGRQEGGNGRNNSPMRGSSGRGQSSGRGAGPR